MVDDESDAIRHARAGVVEHDVTGRVVAVDYEFQPGGSQILVCQHAMSRADREDDHVAR